jgi:hypothetical protein
MHCTQKFDKRLLLGAIVQYIFTPIPNMKKKLKAGKEGIHPVLPLCVSFVNRIARTNEATGLVVFPLAQLKIMLGFASRSLLGPGRT